MSHELLEQDKFRNEVRYDKKFPRLFDLGDLSAVEEDVIYSILGELRDRYTPEGLVFSYADIAYMSGQVAFDPRRKVSYARTGAAFNKKIEELQQKLKVVSYKSVKKVNEKGEITKFEDVPLFTERFVVDHENQILTVFLSNAKIQDEIINGETGEIEQNEMTVVDLFNNDDWSKTQYLKFGREFHNLLRSQYAKRLYRFLSENRTYGRYKISAEIFERDVMKLNTPALIKKKKEKIDAAVKALQELTDEYDTPVFQNLELTREKYGNKLVKYCFTFKHFSLDLNRVVSKKGNQITFDVPPSPKQLEEPIAMTPEKEEVLKLFDEVFGLDQIYNNRSNRQYITDMVDKTSFEVVKEAISRTAIDKRRGFGWTRRVLENWHQGGVRDLKAIEEYEYKTFGKKSTAIEEDSSQTTNVPDWANMNPNEAQKKVLEERRKFLKQVAEAGVATKEDYAEYDRFASIIDTWPEKIYVPNNNGLDEYLNFVKSQESYKKQRLQELKNLKD